MFEQGCPRLHARARARDGRLRVQVDVHIERHAKNWTVDRIAPLERAILRTALLEMLHPELVEADTPIPPEGAIDEAVETAKAFCGADAPGFVNGILAAVLRFEEQRAPSIDVDTRTTLAVLTLFAVLAARPSPRIPPKHKGGDVVRAPGPPRARTSPSTGCAAFLTARSARARSRARRAAPRAGRARAPRASRTCSWTSDFGESLCRLSSTATFSRSASCSTS